VKLGLKIEQLEQHLKELQASARTLIALPPQTLPTSRRSRKKANGKKARRATRTRRS